MLWYVSMSEINMQDKIAETIANMIRKGNVFAKVKKIEKLVYGCAMLVVVFGTSIIINGIYNSQLLIHNSSEQEKQQIIICKQTTNLKQLQYKIDNLLDFNTKLIKLLFKQNETTVNNEMIGINSSLSSLTCDLEIDDHEELDEDTVLVNSSEI